MRRSDPVLVLVYGTVTILGANAVSCPVGQGSESIVSVWAGRGFPGAVDGSALTLAKFYHPRGVSFSPDGASLAVADCDNHLVRTVDVTVCTAAPCNLVGTLAGTAETRGSADGVGTAASFKLPQGVSYSPDGLFVAIADSFNHKIRLVTVDTGATVTLAGSGAIGSADGVGTAASFKIPKGVSYSPNGMSVAVADSFNYKIRLITIATRTAITLSGSGAQGSADGAGAAATFNVPSGLPSPQTATPSRSLTPTMPISA